MAFAALPCIVAVQLTPTGALSSGAPNDGLLMPNVRAKRATAVARQARAVENATAPRTGPGGLPLALRLSEGLGISPRGRLTRVNLHR